MIPRPEPASAAVRIDKKLVSSIRPETLAAMLKQLQSKEPKARPRQFVETLFEAYEYARLKRKIDAYIDQPLIRISDVLTLLPGADYSLRNFTRDLYFLDTSDVEETRAGYWLSLSHSTGKSHWLEYFEHVALESIVLCSRIVVNKEQPLHDLAKILRAAAESAAAPGRTGSLLQEIALSYRKERAPGFADRTAWVRRRSELDPRLALTLSLFAGNTDPEMRRRVLDAWIGDPMRVSDLRAALKAVDPTGTHVVSRPVKGQTLLRFEFLCRFVSSAGYAGWVLLLDEAEMISRYSLRQRGRADAHLAQLLGMVRGSRIPGLACVATITKDYAGQVLYPPEADRQLRPRRRRIGEDRRPGGPLRGTLRGGEQDARLHPVSRRRERRASHRPEAGALLPAALYEGHVAPRAEPHGGSLSAGGGASGADPLPPGGRPGPQPPARRLRLPLRSLLEPRRGAPGGVRSYRLGQTQPVNVYRYVMTATIEERIDALLKSKRRLFEEIVEGASLDPARLLDQEDLFGLVGLAPPRPAPADPTGEGLEERVAALLARPGYRVERAGGQGDGGVDVIGEKRDVVGTRLRLHVQCKATARPAGVENVRSLCGALPPGDRSARGVVACPAGFTPDALRFAAARQVELWDEARLKELEE